MRQLWVWMLLMALAFVNDRCHCCLQEERNSLLEIKAWFSHAGAGFSYLQGWDKEDLYCCNWDWISCDSTTNRVIELDLSYINYDALEKDLYLNASLFLPFKELETLYLSGNQLVGGLKNQGFQALASGLMKLKDLGLRYNKFNDSILSSLSGFSTLEYLDLSTNCFTGTIDLGGLASGLRKLKILYLSDNKFNDNILSSLSGFSTLESLDLSNNSFTGTVGLRGLRKLEVLHLESSDFKENILLESLGGLPSLKTLDASESKFEGKHFGKGLCNSTSLETMFLDSSSLPASFLESIGTTLKVLYLTEVDFHGTLSAQALQNLTKLEELYLDDVSTITTSFLRIIGPLPALRTLSLEGCMLNGTLPHQGWCELKNLEWLYLGQNSLKGVLPPCLGNLSSLTYLDLSDNQFEGNIPPLPQLEHLSISNNNIHGQIARNTCLIFPGLKSFKMANNNLRGCIPPCFGNMSSLEHLDLSNNHMSCELFEHNLPRGGSSLRFLKLSNNNFNGRLTPSVFNMTQLECLFLDGNKFVGEVPGTFSLAESSLQFVDISNNHLSGMLPRGIRNSSIYHKKAIDLSRNSFEGTIPIEYFNSYGLELLDLSENNLSGSLPLGFEAPSLRYVHLYRNQLSGPLPYAFFNLSSLVTLDLGDNNLTGPIPHWIDSLSDLSIFVLKSNQFNGELPHQLCLLRRLSILDLSENIFSGHLPSCLSNLNFIASDEKSWYSYRMMPRVYKRFVVFGNSEINVEIPIELTSKKNFYTYMGDVLRYMSAMDLSCNKFTGEIPIEWGNLSGIYSLNLSQNNLTGLIPSSFSNLKQIESLDLSHNNLNGRIPAQLIELTFLAVFNVSYNNLSGRTPEMKKQFATFDESSYKGNPLLCGPLLRNSCDKTESPSERVPDNSNGDDGSIDMDSFYVSFGMCYIIMVLTILAVLCINPHWRRRWFYFIEECIETCYCVLAINFRKFFRSRR